MATTLRLQDSINFTSSIIKNQPQLVNNEEPALMCGNIVLGTMLGPPCKWPFNRRNISFDTVVGQTDYPVAVADFRFLDVMWIAEAEGGNSENTELQGMVSLAKEGSSQTGRPTKISPQYEDGEGNITFRIANAPSKVYTVYIDYMMKMQLMTSAGSAWGVVPDEFAYIFNQGYLALMMLLVNDERFPIMEAYFIGRLLGAQGGLTDQEKLIFLRDWTAFTATLQSSQGKTAAGLAGRAK